MLTKKKKILLLYLFYTVGATGQYCFPPSLRCFHQLFEEYLPTNSLNWDIINLIQLLTNLRLEEEERKNVWKSNSPLPPPR